jgi:hypothetical protein
MGKGQYNKNGKRTIQYNTIRMGKEQYNTIQ